MIRLTHESIGCIYVDPEKIVDIYPAEYGKARLTLVIGEGYRVAESPEEVVRKVLEYKLAMDRYKAGLIILLNTTDADEVGVTMGAESLLRNLAGLEGESV